MYGTASAISALFTGGGNLAILGERAGAAIGVLVTMQESTAEMRREATAAGFFRSADRKYPRIQLISVTDIFDGKGIQRPGEDVTEAVQPGGALFLPGLERPTSAPRRGVRIKVPLESANAPVQLYPGKADPELPSAAEADKRITRKKK